jgi:tRNA pseudouridine55 synthase
VHGLALIDKPSGPTSFTVMRNVERTVGAEKAGHGGTLDPLASGLLIVLLGEATKLTPWVQGRDKRYTATIRFGIGTDTLDADGTIVAEAPVPRALLAQTLPGALTGFIGDQMQRPPAYSALKVDGRSHMSRARAGEVVIVEPRPARCHGLEVLAIDEVTATLEVHVGSGYYVRALARDLGEALGVPAHLAALERTAIGPWRLADAVAPESVTEATLIPLTDALPDIPTVVLEEELARDVGHGKRVQAVTDAPEAMLVDTAGRPLAMAERVDGGLWAVKRGFFLPDDLFCTPGDSLIDKVPSDR